MGFAWLTHADDTVVVARQRVVVHEEGLELLDGLFRRLCPVVSVPFFFRCMADFTRLPAAFPYLAMRRRYAKRVLKRIADYCCREGWAS
jgi:hypothetical protein